MRTLRRRARWFRAVCMLPLLLAAGCETMPNPLSVLFGTWYLTLDDMPNEPFIILKFGPMGNLLEVGEVDGNVETTESNATVDATVDGSSVEFETSTGVEFIGTFNAEFTIATGTQYSVFRFFNTTRRENLGAATLTKQ